MERAHLRDLIGRSVVTSDGVTLGEVLDVELDFASWRVTWLFIALDRRVTERFHVDAPLVVGTKAIALQPAHVAAMSADSVRLSGTLTDVILDSVVSFDTDSMRHLGARVR